MFFRRVFEIELSRRCIAAGLALVAKALRSMREPDPGRCRINGKCSIAEVRTGGEIVIQRGSSRAVKEYLATLDDTAWGAASDVVPKFAFRRSDPAAQWTGAHKGPAFFAYSDNYLHRREVRRHR